MRAQSIDSPEYVATTDDSVVAHALSILESRIKRGPVLSSPDAVKSFLRLLVGGLEREVFGTVFLDAQHNVISHEIMFTGTLSQTSVYPREIVKAALLKNAGAVILFHNHPSGSCEPSRADEHVTATIKASLNLVDVRVLDHLIVSATGALSFAERGLI
jgi:DNA repair protein RadC